MADTHDLWLAVDRLTKPSTVRLDRDTDTEWLDALRTDPLLSDRDRATYRAATTAHATVASLWQQAVWALTTGAETAAGNPSPLASRSPADLDLMEIMATIRETVSLQLASRDLTPRDGLPAQLRQLAAHVGGHEPDHVGWWTFRIAQWARVLAVYLRAVDVGPRPVRLRNAPCPLCRTRQVTLDTTTGPVVAGPLLIDFESGWIRAATCTACGAVWWRGVQLQELADAIGDTPERMQA